LCYAAAVRHALPVLLLVFAAPAAAADRLDGPVAATLLRVVDGDTVVVRAHIWLGQTVETHLRLAGIDAPELRGGCPAERLLAEAARDFLAAMTGTALAFRDLRYDKYGGRLLARVETERGEDLAAALIAAGLARPYAGKRRAGWCGLTE
jgi:micrococcal nuclease